MSLPDKFHFEPYIGFLCSVIGLGAYSIQTNRQTDKQTNRQNNSINIDTD